MSGFGAWLVSPLGTAVLDFILFAAGLAIGAGWGYGRGREKGYEDACKDQAEYEADEQATVWQRAQRSDSQVRTAATEPGWSGSTLSRSLPSPPSEGEPVHVGQALALVRDDLTDSAYTADMAARMDAIILRLAEEEEGFRAMLAGVPYSADELWSGQ